ncbi:MAG TPA: hypothetical protein VFK24_10410 [Gammaproteobacteria bacterium]|nr:hypothetical protein [Gammaproteobacteria bacterium]
MTKGKTAQLYLRFPGLYAAPDEVEFRCENGWFDLLLELSESLASLAGAAGLQPGDADYPRVTTVKEKFGHLRVYTTAGKSLRSEITDLLNEFELRSAQVCEVCGLPGTTQRLGGARLTLCAHCVQRPTDW